MRERSILADYRKINVSSWIIIVQIAQRLSQANKYRPGVSPILYLRMSFPMARLQRYVYLAIMYNGTSASLTATGLRGRTLLASST